MPEESAEYQSCDVCGRTILRGEQVREYVTPQGDDVAVCTLCVARAEAAGWLPAELAEQQTQVAAARRRRGAALRARLGKVAERARGAAAARSETGDAGQHEREQAGAERPKPESTRKPRTTREPQEMRKPQEARQSKRPAPPKPRAPRTPERVMRRAVERFNTSPEARKVAGLIRSLGEPNVAIRVQGRIARITVAWELSWYQWEVDTDGDAEGKPEPVREVAKGKEVSELSEEARTWNAAAGQDGTLTLRK